MIRYAAATILALLIVCVIGMPTLRKASAQTGIDDVSRGYIYKSENAVPGQYVVMLLGDLEASVRDALAYELAGNYRGAVVCVPFWEGGNAFLVNMSEESALALSQDPRVQFVEEMPAAGFDKGPPEPQPEIPVYPDPDDKLVEPDADEDKPRGGAESELISPLPASTYILKRAANPRYFSYGNQTVALFGMSASYLPHVYRDRPRAPGAYDPIKENCTPDIVGQTTSSPEPKYVKCVKALKQYGLNHFQIWVSLNHSVGMLRNDRQSPEIIQPYDHEQPFKRVGNKWLISKNGTDVRTDQNFDSVFFTNLKTVVDYCQGQHIIVGVVLFDPWSGWQNSQPAFSPWYGPNNNLGIGFTDPHYFAKGDNPNGNPDNEIDSPANQTNPNWVLRKRQVDLMQKTAYELSAYNNFYWILANEPDMGGKVTGKDLINWHKYMAKRLWDYEENSLGRRHHLIGANLASNDPTLTPDPGASDDAITTLSAYDKIDIITGHYDFLQGNRPATGPPQVTEAERHSAIKLITRFNEFEANGLAKPFNKKIYGFTESRPTGTDADLVEPRTADAARVEAWEFFIDGGGLFDHLSYRWANPVDTANLPVPKDVLLYYSYLSKFLSPIPLDNMKRLTKGQTDKWIADLPNQPELAPHWAAMGDPVNFNYLLYLHRSTYSGLYPQDRYDVATSTTTSLGMITIQKLTRGCYKAEWFYPDGKRVGNSPPAVSGNVLLPIDRYDFPISGVNSTYELTRPKYKQDILLKITRRSANPTPCTPGG